MVLLMGMIMSVFSYAKEDSTKHVHGHYHFSINIDWGWVDDSKEGTSSITSVNKKVDATSAPNNKRVRTFASNHIAGKRVTHKKFGNVALAKSAKKNVPVIKAICPRLEEEYYAGSSGGGYDTCGDSCSKEIVCQSSDSGNVKKQVVRQTAATKSTHAKKDNRAVTLLIAAAPISSSHDSDKKSLDTAKVTSAKNSGTATASGSYGVAIVGDNANVTINPLPAITSTELTAANSNSHSTLLGTSSNFDTSLQIVKTKRYRHFEKRQQYRREHYVPGSKSMDLDDEFSEEIPRKGIDSFLCEAGQGIEQVNHLLDNKNLLLATVPNIINTRWGYVSITYDNSHRRKKLVIDRRVHKLVFFGEDGIRLFYPSVYSDPLAGGP